MKKLLILAVLAPLFLSACFLAEVDDQTNMLADVCRMGGTISSANPEGELIVVVLNEGGGEEGVAPVPVDHSIADRNGQWRFSLAPREYSLLAFQDSDGNLMLDDHEPALRVAEGDPFDCTRGGRLEDIEIAIGSDDRLQRVLSIGRDRGVLSAATQTAVSLGQLTAFGEVASLDDSRFDSDIASDGLWRPMDFIRAGHAGVYLQEPLDPGRVPVLFIHGINGSPRVLAAPVKAVASERFQPMFYYYPSGLRLDRVVNHLYAVTREMELRHGIERMHVVAHSMGGLVARAWLQERHQRGSPAEVASFISVSAPWSGYQAARQGVTFSPIVVPVWRDMATGSEFLGRLFEDGGSSAESGGLATPHHLIFSYRQDGWISREAGDGVATLASMLPPVVQQQAASIYGVNAGHVEVLEAEAALERIQRILHDVESGIEFSEVP